jgi:hypothetical protein
MFNAESGPDLPSDFNSRPEGNDEPLLSEPLNLVLDLHLRQLLIGDYVVLPCFNSVVDRGMVVAITGSIVEFMILAPDTGIPETLVLDMRKPDPQTGLFGRYGYTGVLVCARKGQPAAADFAKQLLSACEEVKSNNPRFNPYLAAQAQTRVEFLKEILQ